MMIDTFTLDIAQSEINRILTRLKLPESYVDPLLDKFKEIYSILDPKRIYRDPELLPALIIYFYCKFNRITINTYNLIEISSITERLFLCFVFQVFEYLVNNRKYDLSYFSIESEYWSAEFQEFLDFLLYYKSCPICGELHKREYLLVNYFHINKILRKKLILNMHKAQVCRFDKTCIFYKNNRCHIGIPCRQCFKEKRVDFRVK